MWGRRKDVISVDVKYGRKRTVSDRLGKVSSTQKI